MRTTRIGSIVLAPVIGGLFAGVAAGQDQSRPIEPEGWPVMRGDSGWYLRGGPMVQQFGDTDFAIFEVEFDAGGGFTLAGGYDFGSLTGGRPDGFSLGARAELELSGMSGDVDSVAGVPANGEVDASALFVNGFLDFDFTGPVSIFTGIGLGHNRVEVDIDGFVDDEDTAFGVQLMIGLEFEINEDWLLYAMSRGRWYDDMRFDGLDTDGFNSSSFEFGARYSF